MTVDRYNFLPKDAEYFVRIMNMKGVQPEIVDMTNEPELVAARKANKLGDHVLVFVDFEARAIAMEVIKEMKRLQVKLHVCDKAGTALKQTILYDGDNPEMAQVAYESACIVIEESYRYHRPLRVVYLTKDGALKSYSKKGAV